VPPPQSATAARIIGALVGLALVTVVVLLGCCYALSHEWLSGLELFGIFVALVMSIPWCMLGVRLRSGAKARRLARDAPGGLPRAQVRARSDRRE
jgi:hypothetical protein